MALLEVNHNLLILTVYS